MVRPAEVEALLRAAGRYKHANLMQALQRIRSEHEQIIDCIIRASAVAQPEHTAPPSNVDEEAFALTAGAAPVVNAAITRQARTLNLRGETAARTAANSEGVALAGTRRARHADSVGEEGDLEMSAGAPRQQARRDDSARDDSSV